MGKYHDAERAKVKAAVETVIESVRNTLTTRMEREELKDLKCEITVGMEEVEGERYIEHRPTSGLTICIEINGGAAPCRCSFRRVKVGP